MIRGKENLIFICILHFFTDFFCAYFLFSQLSPRFEPEYLFLIYNFAAFALQMPLGILLDHFVLERENTLSYEKIFIVCGVILVLVGGYTSPWILGLGNALFHVGGGVLSIEEDDTKNWHGQGLGAFVAPGAIGLFLGNVLSSKANTILTIVLGGVYVIVAVLLWVRKDEVFVADKSTSSELHLSNDLLISMAICFLVVIGRSYLGLTITMPWKTTFLLSFIFVLAVAIGKTAGGILAYRIGNKWATYISLGLAGVLLLGKQYALLGILGIFFFNMTMPITLYELKNRMPKYPGFAFGILTFGLFLGYWMKHYLSFLDGDNAIAILLVCILSMGLLGYQFTRAKE